MAKKHPVKAWHLGAVGIAALIWYAVLVADYVSARLQLPFVKTALTEKQIEFLTTLPWWVDIGWGVGVWLGLAGAWLLFRRNGWAPMALGLALIGTLVMTIYMLIFGTVGGDIGFTGIIMLIGSAAIQALFYLYARSMKMRGSLV